MGMVETGTSEAHAAAQIATVGIRMGRATAATARETLATKAILAAPDDMVRAIENPILAAREALSAEA